MGLFLSFEGPDGSGKSTQARLLAESLRREGRAVLETVEPGGTPLGDVVRRLALDPTSPPASPLAMALLMSASRAQLVEKVIVPALATGKVVISDRYADSTMAYQSYGQGVAHATVVQLTAIATGGLQPDGTIFVDVSPDIGLGRVADRGRSNRLDAETLNFHQRVRHGYLEIIAREPERWKYIDGSATPNEVHAAILRAVRPLLEKVA